MPSLNRPNAPNRLPSADFGELFLKPRALRTSDPRSAGSTPSPLSTPANIAAHRRAFRSSEGSKSYSPSPLASPAISTSQRRPVLLERSERVARSVFSKESLRPSAKAPEVIQEEPISSAQDESSAASSISDRGHASSHISDYSSHVATSHDRAPREARTGFKWTRDFLGGWLEIRVGKQKGSNDSLWNEQSQSGSEEVHPSSSSTSVLDLPLTHVSTTAESTDRTSGQPLLPDTPDPFDSSSTLGPLREGLYCRTKRRLGLKHGPITPYIQPQARTPTGAVLDRVTSTLRFLPPRKFSGASSAATSVSNLSIAAPRKPRGRRGRRSEWSASSSVRDLAMGKPPTGTPEPESMYTGSDSQKYLTVDLTQPDAPAFLPSEARRINTPPLPSEGSSRGHSRGFFFDYQRPSETDLETFPRRLSYSPHISKSAGNSNEREWYRMKLDDIESSAAVEYESNIPEHFPNSPLCPRNPKHKSGGTGTCPYHGKNESTPSDAGQTPTLVQTESLSPVPENWWMK